MYPPPLGQVMDLAQQLSGPEKRRLAAISADAKRATGADVRFVVIDALRGYKQTTPGEEMMSNPLRAYATNLFNHWRVGGSGEKNNGVLVLLVKDSRRVEVVVGKGLDNTVIGARGGWCAAALQREAVRVCFLSIVKKTHQSRLKLNL